MNSENAFKKLGQKLMNGEITPEEHVKEYNKLLRELAEKYEISDMVTLKASDDASKDDAKDDTEAADDTEADTAEEK